MNNGQVIYDKIYSDLSLKTHLSRIEGFAAWLKNNHPEVRDLQDITQDIAGQYLQQQQNDNKSAYTISADMLAINRVQIATGNWEQPIKKSDYGLKNRNFADLRNNNSNRSESQTKQDEIMRYKYREIIAYGQAFGLRRSELLPSGDTSNRKTVAGSHSLYSKNGKIYHVTTGKGGRLRAIECLDSHVKYITDNYGDYIKPMPSYLQKNDYSRQDIAKFKLEHKQQSERFFDSVDRSLRIHVECRQYYANQKLTEIMQNREETYINEEKVKINGIEIPKDVADFIAYQLGHGPNRYDVLRRYIGR